MKTIKRFLSFLVALLFTVSSCLIVSPSELFAAPSAAAPIALPASVPAGASTQILITSQMIRAAGDPAISVTNATLNQLDSAGKLLKNWGAMRDDGQQGDAAAGDNNFSLRINVTPGAQAAALYFQVSVAFRAVVRRYITPTTTVPVISSNQPPVITSVPETSAVNGFLFSYEITATDPESGEVVLSLFSGPEGMKLVDKKLVWVPTDEQLGSHPVEIRATDPQNAFAKQNFVVEVTEFNLTPIITSVPPRFAKTAEKYSYDVDAFDPEGKPLTFTFGAPPPGGMTINQLTGLIEYTPDSNDAGVQEVAITVGDHLGATDEQVYDLDVLNKNLALELLSPAGQHQIPVGETLELPLSANIPTAVFSALPMPENAAMDQEKFTFTPAASQVGFHTVSFKAHVGDMVVSNAVVIEVTKSNTAPILDPVAAQTVLEGESLTFLLNATDAENDPLTITAPGLSLANAYLNQITNQFIFTPSFTQAGAHSVVFQVSDGTGSSQITVPITVQDVVPATTVLNLVVDKTPNPTFRTTLPVTGNVIGEAGVPPAPEPPVIITGLNPALIRQGETKEITLTGLNTNFTQDVSVADFGDGVTVQTLEVLSPTSAKAKVVVAGDAEPGIRQVKIVTLDQEAPSVVALNVEKGAASVTGRVVDSFTQQPLEGARIGLNGTPNFAITGADGKFNLVDIPPGQQILLIARSNYAVVQYGVVLNNAEALAIFEDIKLNALARPFNPGGSLPRAATLASVLDRGASNKDVNLDLDQAKALIQDTMIVVGGDEGGVVDEAGNQLNPHVDGFGQFTLTQQGVENQAKALLMGEVYTLKQFVDIITTAFRFPLGLSTSQVIEGFQEAANEAWANPSDPLSAMAIVLFNEGNNFSAEAPVITENTRFNRFQMFLLSTSLLAFNAFQLDISAESMLQAHGIDFEPLMPEPAFPTPPSAGSLAAPSPFAPLGDALVPDAGADTASNPCNAPECRSRDIIGNKTFTNVYRKIGANMIYDCAYAAAFAATIAAAQLAFVGFTIGLTGGAAGVGIAGLTILAAASLGFASTAFFKAVIGWFIALAASSFEPPPPFVHNTTTDADGNFVIPFDRSPEEINTLKKEVQLAGNTDHLRRSFTYLLYRFPTCNLNIGESEGEIIPVLPIEDPRHPNNIDHTPHTGRLQFVVPRTMMKQGVNQFRIQTVQYVHHASKKLVEGIGPADTNNQGFISLSQFQKGGLGDKNSFEAFDRNDDNKLTDDEFRQYPVPAELKTESGHPAPPMSRYLARTDRQPDAVNQDVVSAQIEAEQKRKLSLQMQTELEVMENFRKEYASESVVPDTSFATENETSFRLGDDIFNDTQSMGRRLVRDPIFSGDAELIIPDAAEEIARRHYQEKLGTQPTQAQIDRVEDMIRTHQEAAKRQAQIQEMGQSMRELGEVMERVRNSPTDIDVEIRIPTGFAQKPSPIGLPFGDFKTLSSGEGFISYNELSYETVTINKANVEEVDLDFRIKEERPVTPTRQMNGTYEHLFKINGPGSMGDHEIVSPPTEEPNATKKSLDLVKESIAQQKGLTPEEVNTRFNQYVTSREGVNPKAAGLANSIEIQENRILNQLDIERQITRTRPALGGGERIMPPAGLSPHFEKSIGVLGDVAGGYISGAVTIVTFLDSIQVLTSEFSPGCITKNLTGFGSTGELFPPGFEPYPSYHQISAILKEHKVSSQPKTGWLRREYPAEDENIYDAETGFPPGFLTRDTREYLYAINMNSTEKYGGRIFRFKPVDDFFMNGPIRGFGLQREMVGAVNYYSLDIQLARPANPVAMVAGPEFSVPAEIGGGNVIAYDLFVANVDGVDGSKRILRVPISLIRTRPSIYGDLPGVPSSQGRRHRIVGQPLIEDPDFKFTGPSDFEVGPDPDTILAQGGSKSIMILSDENNIFVLTRGANQDSYNIQKVVSMPGKRWSGMAFDQRGRLYFAEYTTGSIYLMDWKDLKFLIANNETITDQQGLEDFTIRLFADIETPGDLEIEFNSPNPGQVLLVSTFKGILPLPLPIIGKVGAGVQEIKIMNFNQEIPVKMENAYNRFIAQPGRFQMIRKSVTIRVRRLNEQNKSYWTEHTVTMADSGVTIIEQPL